MISLVVAVGKNNEIGKDNKMLWHNKEELKFFKNLTLNHKIIMGRKTFESISKKLENRENIVISKTLKSNLDIHILSEIDEILKRYEKLEEEVFVIGGESIYKQSIKYANKIYLSKLDLSFENADKYFPKIRENEFILKEKINYNTFVLEIYERDSR